MIDTDFEKEKETNDILCRIFGPITATMVDEDRGSFEHEVAECQAFGRKTDLDNEAHFLLDLAISLEASGADKETTDRLRRLVAALATDQPIPVLHGLPKIRQDWSPIQAPGLWVNLPNCPRCSRPHKDLAISPFTQPPEGWTHWAVCPTNGQPISIYPPGIPPTMEELMETVDLVAAHEAAGEDGFDTQITGHTMTIESSSTVIVEGNSSQFDKCLPIRIPDETRLPDETGRRISHFLATQHKDCQSGLSIVCKASRKDGVICPDNSCDIDDKVRPDPDTSVDPVEATEKILTTILEGRLICTLMGEPGTKWVPSFPAGTVIIVCGEEDRLVRRVGVVR